MRMIKEFREWLKAQIRIIYIGWDYLFKWQRKGNKGQANLFGIVCLVYLGFMLVVLLTIF